MSLVFISCTLVSFTQSTYYGYRPYYNTKSASLRLELNDIVTQFLENIRQMFVNGDMTTWKESQQKIITNDFIFPSDISGITYNGSDHFLNDTSGFGVGLNGSFSSVTTLVGSNIVYKNNAYNEILMLVPTSTTLWRNTCSTNSSVQGIIEDEINEIIMREERYYYSWKSQWKIAKFASQGSRVQKISC